MVSSPPNPSIVQLSQDISVGKYELAFLWPISLQWKRDSHRQLQRGTSQQVNKRLSQGYTPALDDFASELSEHGWTDVDGSYPPLPNLHEPGNALSTDRLEAEAAYAEFCYYHPLVRHFLYPNRDDIRAANMSSIIDQAIDPRLQQSVIRWQNRLSAAKNRNLRILKKNDWSGLSVDYAMELQESTAETRASATSLRTKFTIQSCWMYLFDTQSAILELRLCYDDTCRLSVNDASTGKAERHEGESIPLSLRMAMHLQDALRRIYPAYWSRTNDCYLAGHCLETVRLHGKSKPSDQSTASSGACEKDLIDSSFGTCSAHDRVPDVASSQFKDATEYLTNVITNREPLAAHWWRKLLEPLRPTTTFEDPTLGNGSICYEFIEDDRAVAFAYLAVPNPRTITDGDWVRLAGLDDEGKSHLYPYAPEFEPASVRESAYDRFYDRAGHPPAQADQNVRWLCSGYSFVAVGPCQGNDFYLDEYAGALAHFRRHYFSLGLLAHFQRASLLRFKHELAETMEALDLHTHRVFRRKNYLRKLEHLLNRMNQFRSVYWTRDVSNQEQGREIFAIWKRKLDLAGLFEDVYSDVQFASSVLGSWAQQRQADAATNLAWIGALFLIVSPTVGIWTNALAGSPMINAGWLGMGLLCACVIVWSGRKVVGNLSEYVVSVLERHGLAEFPTPKQRSRLLLLTLALAIVGISVATRKLTTAVNKEAASQKLKDGLKDKTQSELIKKPVQTETGSKSSSVATPPQNP